MKKLCLIDRVSSLMKARLALWMGGVMIGVLLCCATNAQADTIRIMVYNITGSSLRLNLNEIATTIIRERPDIIGLNEIYNGGGLAGNQVEFLRRRIERNLGGRWHARFGGNLRNLQGHYGNAIISRFPIIRHYNIHLPRRPGDEQRGALIAQIDLGAINNGAEFRVAVTHLRNGPDWDDFADRRDGARTIINHLHHWYGGFKIVMGDMNEIYAIEDGVVSRFKRGGYGDAWEIARGTPKGGWTIDNMTKLVARFDYQFVLGRTVNNRTMVVKDCYVVHTGRRTGSQHLPVVAVYRFMRPPTSN